jgi:hypothetical protein
VIRKNFMLTPRHAEQLKRESETKEVSMSEILRKALDAFFNVKGGK